MAGGGEARWPFPTIFSYFLFLQVLRITAGCFLRSENLRLLVILARNYFKNFPKYLSNALLSAAFAKSSDVACLASSMTSPPITTRGKSSRA